MIIDMTGGAGLNFFVAAYADENALLADLPGVNTIGVVTTVEFPGWCFSPEEPKTPEDGLLWFKTGDPLYTDAPFSAIAGNTIMVYPLSAFQYQAGAWVEIPSRTYQDKSGTMQWVEWIKQTLHLIEDGVLRAEFAVNDPARVTVTQGDDGVTIKVNSTQYKTVLIELDLTHYNTLVIEGTNQSSSNKVGAWGTDVTPTHNNAAKSASIGSTGKTTLDISDLSGVYNVGVCMMGTVVATNFYLARS